MIKDLKYYPAVYTVKDNYQIVVFSELELLVGIKVGEKIYYDNSNGVKRSFEKVHKVIIPISELDKEQKYEVVYRRIIDRKGDYTETENEVSISFDFKPASLKERINIYQVADAHQKYVYPHAAAKFFGEDLDLLVINGDSFDYLNKEEDLEYILDLVSDITKGEIATIFAKGNHDNKGRYAEKLVDYVGSDNGNSYYTFRLGKLWGLVLDCGENCDDNTDFYGNTVCHHDMRLKETEFIKEVIKNKNNEYLAQGVENRIVISHAAINNVRCKPFDIEIDIYKEWVELINKNIKPNFMLSGHLHITEFCLPHSEFDTLDLNCPFVIGAEPVGWMTGTITDYVGLAVELKKTDAKFMFTDSKLNIKEEHCISLEKKVESLKDYLDKYTNPVSFRSLNITLPGEYSYIKAIKYTTKPNNEVFAFIGYPSSPMPKDGYKAVVCVHGGAGYAFYEWVKFWNDRGYVAIAPDFNGGEYQSEEARTIRNENGGPIGYGSVDDYDLDDKWLYHSVLSAKQAVSILYNDTKVDKNNIFAQGISWGGFISLAFASFENRLKKLSIVYSSAFISNSDWGRLIGIGAIPRNELSIYDNNIDPGAYIKNISCPVIFTAGCDDGAFMMKNRIKTVETITTSSTLSIRRHYTHGHIEGWSELEPYYFFEEDLTCPIVKEKDGIVSVENIEKFKGSSLVATYDDILEKDNICSWFEIDFEKEIKIPKDVKYYFVNTTNDKELIVSSKVYKV